MQTPDPASQEASVTLYFKRQQNPILSGIECTIEFPKGSDGKRRPKISESKPNPRYGKQAKAISLILILFAAKKNCKLFRIHKTNGIPKIICDAIRQDGTRIFWKSFCQRNFFRIFEPDYQDTSVMAINLNFIKPENVIIFWDTKITSDPVRLNQLAEQVAITGNWELADYQIVTEADILDGLPNSEAAKIEVNTPPVYPDEERSFSLRLIRMPLLPLGDRFIRRQLLLKAFEDIQKEATNAGVQRCVFFADGGIGKTAFVVELGYQLHTANTFDFVFFLAASTTDLLHTEIAALSDREWLNLPQQSAPELEYRRKAVIAWLSLSENAMRTLMILDGVDSEEARVGLRNLLPSIAKCSVLITSRHIVWPGFQVNELKIFTPDESRAYLLQNLDKELIDERSPIDDIAVALDHLPLALELVTSYISETRQTTNEWLKEWQSNAAATLVFHDDSIPYPVSLDRVWEKSVSRLTLAAREMLNAFAFIAPSPAALPVKFLKGKEDWVEIRTSLAQLSKASLIKWPSDLDSISIHRILQTVTRHQVKDRSHSLQVGYTLINSENPTATWGDPTWERWEEAEAHIQSLLSYTKTNGDKCEATGLMSKYGWWLFLQGRSKEGEAILREALQANEGLEFPNNLQMAFCLHNLANVIYATGRMREAEPYHNQSRAIVEEHFGSESAEIIESLNAEFVMAMNGNKYKEAEPLMLRLRSLIETHLSSDDPRKAQFLFNIANWHRGSGKTSEGEALFRQVIALDAGCSQPNDAMAAQRLMYFANFLESIGDIEAESTARRALQIVQLALGPENNRVAPAMMILAKILANLGKDDEAQRLFHSAIKILEKTFGFYHNDLIENLIELASLKYRQDELKEALRYAERARKIEIRNYLINRFIVEKTRTGEICELILKAKGFSDQKIKIWADRIYLKVQRDLDHSMFKYRVADFDSLLKKLSGEEDCKMLG